VFHHFTYAFALLAAGALILAFGVYAWAIEPPTAEDHH